MAVVLITVDGVRPDAIQQVMTPTFDKLMIDGSYSLSAQSVMPTVTLPCHMSMFHSVPPTRHGILTNDYSPMVRPIPGLFEQVRSAAKTSATFYTWDVLRDLSRPLMVSRTYHVEVNYENLKDSDKRLVDIAEPLIAGHAYDFFFIHMDAADELGHIFGWMSDEQLAQVEVLDALIGRLVAALPEDSQILVQADHGGHDRLHGTDHPADMTIPYFLYGAGIRAGHEFTEAVTLLDTAPTIAHLLDVPFARDWEGNVLRSALL
jgi:predicted AlkP superfamily pyrophosphatase or phosphodiesterase